MRLLVVSTYELGHQPLEAGRAAAALRAAGHEVAVADLAVAPLEDRLIEWAEGLCVTVPMHTGLRLARALAASVRRQRPDLPICFVGLYAVVPTEGVAGFAGEYLGDLQAWASRPTAGPPRVSLRTTVDPLPDRRDLAPLARYARLRVAGEERLAAAVEASRGCAHRCRHCPVPVVYQGRTRVVPPEQVVADATQVVAAGATHLSFSDPDFLNRPAHAGRVVAALHEAFPGLTFDVTVKIEHVLRYEDRWPAFARAGCLFVTTALETVDDWVLARLAKGHDAADAEEAVGVLRRAGIEPRPSLLPFTPWTTPASLHALFDAVARWDLVGNVDPVQFAVRLLLPPGSLLLEDPDVQAALDGYDDEALGWRWRHRDPRLDDLAERLGSLAERAAQEGWGPVEADDALRAEAASSLGLPALRRRPAVQPGLASALPADERPRLTEAWFCCAEPTRGQLARAQTGGGNDIGERPAAVALGPCR
ncbi:radical SAM protein [Aciditerrimonas ferrireducens]|uniref:radical SAM protein n=1 Tax=Aciditerrimonas ferrireducens TaxID=667306 RepID=UPI002004CB42|nr:radical SAM protein [Aciditerrimonas ferrireducens]MCK4177242.1 radical SAM protein [Aciditerrimonas ferrireducens]